MEKKFAKRSFYAAFDSPEAALPGFWERFWVQVEEKARLGETVIVLLDEAHVLPNWSTLLKAEWDRLARIKLPVHIVATGSSALNLAKASRESLAGRFERLLFTQRHPLFALLYAEVNSKIGKFDKEAPQIFRPGARRHCSSNKRRVKAKNLGQCRRRQKTNF